MDTKQLQNADAVKQRKEQFCDELLNEISKYELALTELAAAPPLDAKEDEVPNEPLDDDMTSYSKQQLIDRILALRQQIVAQQEAVEMGTERKDDDEAEKVLADCTVDDIVTVLLFMAEDDDEEKERDSDHEAVDGVFSRFQKLGGNDLESMAEVVEWREKMVEWVRSEGVDGKVIADSLNDGELIEGMKRALVPDDDGTASLDGACGSILNLCRKHPVHGLLAAAKQRAVTRFDALKQYLVQHHDVGEKDIDALNEMVLDGGYESETLALSKEWNPMECAQFIASFIRDRKCMTMHSLSTLSSVSHCDLHRRF